MGQMEQGSLQRRIKTPLGIIALFISVTETVLGIGVTQTSGGIQITITVFVLSFPLIIAGTFFFILWKKPWALYAPTEYGDGTNVEDYVREMSGKAKPSEELQIYPQIQQSIRDALVSPQIITELSKIVLSEASTARKTVKEILNDAVIKAEDTILKGAFFTVDSRPFAGANGSVWQIPYSNYTTVDSLLDNIYFALEMIIPPFTYTTVWVLGRLPVKCWYGEEQAQQSKAPEHSRYDQSGQQP